MHRISYFALASLASLAAASAATAAPVVIDFSSLPHGAVIGAGPDKPGQFVNALPAPLLSVGVVNPNDGGPDGPDLAVVFYPSETGTADPDLENDFTPVDVDGGDAGFSAGPVTVAGGIVIVQENDAGCSDGVCDSPDDDLHGGVLTFVFDSMLNPTIETLDILDIDGRGEAVKISARDKNGDAISLLQSFDNGTVVTDAVTNSIVIGEFGNNHSTTLNFGQFFGDVALSELRVEFESSGAVGNLVVHVPAPGSLAFLAFGGALAWRIGRRKTA